MSSDESLRKLVLNLEEFVQSEARATRGAYDERWALPIAERVAAGYCIDQMRFMEVVQERFLRFEFSDNISDFREGDLIRVSADDPKQPILKGSLYRVEDDQIWIEPSERSQAVVAELLDGIWALDGSYLDLEWTYLNALKELGNTERGRSRILPLLNGELKPNVDIQQFQEASEKAEEENTNESQSEAIAQAVATDLCHLVQGPPGTGKTFVLAHVVKQRVARGERVLITAATHRAIHNALNMIRKIAPEIADIAKIGREIYDPDLQVQQYESFSDSPLSQCDGGYVVGATPFTARGRRLKGVDFDAVIIDEAGQVTLPLAAMAMLSANVYIFVGDHKQLPPVIQTASMDNDEARESVFAKLSGRGFDTMLDITYRMNAELARWPAENFYGGKLRSAESCVSRRLPLLRRPQALEEIIDPAKPLVFVQLDHVSAQKSSAEEAKLVADILEELARSGLPLTDAAVVVPFRRQARRIKKAIREKGVISREEASTCVIDTVDRMQGQEREVIIVSMTASEPAYVERLLRFLLQPQRLNVAVTRARSKAIILASEELARVDPVDPEAVEFAALWKSLRAACEVIVM